MNKQVISKIWKDPVWSKVISVGVLGLITLIFNFLLWGNSKSYYLTTLEKLWTYKLQAWIIVVAVLILAAIVYLINNRFRYNDETLNVDRRLFNEIRNGYSMTDFILDVKSHCFSSRPVGYERIQTMINFLGDSNKPDFEFLNPTLDKLKAELIGAFVNLDRVMDQYIFVANNTGWVAIPSEWEREQPERFIEAKATLRHHEERLVACYQKFISQGRRILRV